MFDKKSAVIHLKLFFTTSVMAFQQFVVGGVLGFSSVVLSQLQRPESDFHVDAEQASWIASLPLLLCPIGSLAFGYLSDRFGRNYALQLTYIPMLLSWIIISNAWCVECIYVARLLAGLTTGTGGVIYVYIAETSPTYSRPFYLLIFTLYVGLGLMTTAALGVVCHWRTVSVVFAVTCLVGSVAPFFVPATPMWLRSRGREEEARRAELWFGFEVTPRCNGPAAEAQITADGPASPCSAAAGVQNRWAVYAQPTVWKPAAAALAFFCCQQATGFYMLLFYSVDVLRDCRVPVDGMTATVYLCAARLTGTVVNLVFQSAPKRWLTVISGMGMGVALSVAICYMYTVGPSGSGGATGTFFGDAAEGLLLWAFLLYVFFAMFAVLPLPWSVCGEIFPMAVKGTMNGVLHSCGYELMFGSIKVYPWLVATFGIRAVWTMCAGSCFATALFGAFLLPETTGKTLNEITDGFRSRKTAKPALITIIP